MSTRIGFGLAALMLTNVPVAAAMAGSPKDRCAAASDVTANFGGYIVADLEGRLSAAERSRYTAEQLASYERQLAVLKPKVEQARAVARLFVEIPYPDSLFDEYQDMKESDRDTFVAQCHAEYVR